MIYPIGAEGKQLGSMISLGFPLAWYNLQVVNNCFDGCFKSLYTNINYLNLLINIIVVYAICFVLALIFNYALRKIRHKNS